MNFLVLKCMWEKCHCLLGAMSSIVREAVAPCDLLQRILSFVAWALSCKPEGNMLCESRKAIILTALNFCFRSTMRKSTFIQKRHVLKDSMFMNGGLEPVSSLSPSL